MRVHLNGEGTPIPTIALPDPNLDDALPPQSFVFSEDGNFVKTDYVGLGYTHFEAICIGASGGRGGGMVSSSPGSFYSYGGAGGGGGLHRIAGLLTDLPDISEIVVGQAGTDGVSNNGHSLVHTYIGSDPPYAWTANPSYIAATDGQDGGASTFNDTTCRASGGKGGKKITGPLRWISDEQEPPGPAGGSGGTRLYESSFGYGDSDTGEVITLPGGMGGEGGVGDRILAGGGAPGATFVLLFRVNHTDPGPGLYTLHQVDEFSSELNKVTSGALVHWRGPRYFISEIPPAGQWIRSLAWKGQILSPAVDGIWDGTIGEGGGGGRGGTFFPEVVASPPVSTFTRPELSQLAVSGGQGSFSYADTSVSGGRGNRSSDPYFGRAIVPGAGGGARASSLLKYGSRATGFNPNGVVYLRLVKIG